MKLSCAVLDDYQDVALRTADWGSLADAVDVEVFHEHIDDEDALVETLGKHEIVVIMRERTPFPRSVLARLPHLRLLVTTGMRNASIDMAAAREQGVVVCGTGGTHAATAELTWALILGLARHVPTETTSLRSGGQWQQTRRRRPQRQHARRHRSGQDRPVRGEDRPGLRHGRRRVEPEPHR